MDGVSHLHHPGVRNAALSFPKLENVSQIFFHPGLHVHICVKKVLPNVLIQWVTQCGQKQGTFTIPHFKYGEQKRFDFNSPCVCKKTTAPPACLSASTSGAEHLSSKEEDVLRLIAAPVPPPCRLPPDTLCSPSCRASTAKWWLWHLLFLLYISWLHTGWSFLSPQFWQ